MQTCWNLKIKSQVQRKEEGQGDKGSIWEAEQKEQIPDGRSQQKRLPMVEETEKSKCRERPFLFTKQKEFKYESYEN